MKQWEIQVKRYFTIYITFSYYNSVWRYFIPKDFIKILDVTLKNIGKLNCKQKKNASPFLYFIICWTKFFYVTVFIRGKFVTNIILFVILMRFVALRPLLSSHCSLGNIFIFWSHKVYHTCKYMSFAACY